MPGPEVPAAGFGSEAGGFRIRAAPAVELYLEAWGYWSVDVVGAFSKYVRASAQRFAGVKVLTLDVRQMKPLRIDGQESLRECFRLLATAPFTRGSVATANALTRMQLTRLFRECGLEERLLFVDSL
jgi:hypothetical protein